MRLDHIFGIRCSDFGNANCTSLTCVSFSSKYIKIVEAASIDTLQLRKVVYMQMYPWKFIIDHKESVAYVWPYVGFLGVGVRLHDGVVMIRIMEVILSIKIIIGAVLIIGCKVTGTKALVTLEILLVIYTWSRRLS